MADKTEQKMSGRLWLPVSELHLLDSREAIATVGDRIKKEEPQTTPDTDRKLQLTPSQVSLCAASYFSLPALPILAEAATSFEALASRGLYDVPRRRIPMPPDAKLGRGVADDALVVLELRLPSRHSVAIFLAAPFPAVAHVYRNRHAGALQCLLGTTCPRLGEIARLVGTVAVVIESCIASPLLTERRGCLFARTGACLVLLATALGYTPARAVRVCVLKAAVLLCLSRSVQPIETSSPLP